MNIYTRKQRWKLLLLLAALLIGISSLWYTNSLVEKLSGQEKMKVELWAQAVRHLSDVTDNTGDLTFAFNVLQSNTTIPVIQTDSNDVLKNFTNLDSALMASPVYVTEQIRIMKSQHEPIRVQYDKNSFDYIYYKDSYLLTNLQYYPYFQLTVITLFLLVSYLAFSTSRKAEQNQVWVGMAKETAHQLGTPLSSLVAWVEYLKSEGQTNDHLREIEKDVSRLQTITDRFSKIGSAPALQKENIKEVIARSIDYIKSRSSSRISFSLTSMPNHSHVIYAQVNIALFEWVLENLFKNAIDAMEGDGSIKVHVTDQQQFVYIDIADSGKGIPKSKFKTVFKPGYTSKSRGWGLGLSLSKRIIEEYHAGQVFVKSSEAGRGTTFRIVLQKYS